MAKVAAWPENTKIVIQALEDAVSMKKLISPVFDFIEDQTQWGLFGKSEQEDATQA